VTTIVSLPELRRRRQERAMQQARMGINADPHIIIELRDLDTTISLMERIDIHRGNLTHLLRQRDHFGPNAPTHIVNQILSERENIGTLRRQCAQLGYSVERHAVDADVPEATPQPTPTMPAESQLDRIERKLDELLRRLSQ
jgi:hypothetical protein